MSFNPTFEKNNYWDIRIEPAKAHIVFLSFLSSEMSIQSVLIL